MRLSKLTRETSKDSKGFTLPEVLIILAVTGILGAIAAPSVLWANNPLQNATNIVSGNFKLARAKAMAATSAYRVRAASSTQLAGEFARNCAAAEADWVTDPGFDLNFQDEELDLEAVELSLPTTVDGVAQGSPSGWSICYNSRGIANSNVVVTLKNKENNQIRTVEVFLGGPVEIR